MLIFRKNIVRLGKLINSIQNIVVRLSRLEITPTTQTFLLYLQSMLEETPYFLLILLIYCVRLISINHIIEVGVLRVVFIIEGIKAVV